MLPAPHVDILCDVAHHIDDLLVFIEVQSFLREIAEAYGIANIELTLVDGFQSEQHLDECRLACAVVAHDAHLLVTREVVIEILQDDDVAAVPFFSVCFRHILALENLRPDVDVARLQPELSLFDALFGHTLQFVESFFARTGFMSTGLRHSSHPFQLAPVEVVGTHNLGACIVDTLLTFLKIVAEVAAISVDGTVVKFKDEIAHTVEEESVVGHHEERFVASREIALEPNNHIEVEMVCRFVENEHVWLREQDIGQGDTLLLTAAELPHGLVEVADVQLRQNLFGAQHLLGLTLMVETGIEDRFLGIELRRLFKIANAEVVAIDDATTVIAVAPRQERQQSRLTRTVLCDEPYPLPLGNAERDVFEKNLRSERLRQVLYYEIWISHVFRESC